MKAWLDFLPLLLFFIAYKTADVFVAAGVLIVSVCTLYGALWLKHRQLESSQWITVIATVLLGGLTLLLHDEAYLQWKAPAVYVVLCAVFMGSQFIGRMTLAERMLGKAVKLASPQWLRLNLAWAVFFLCSAGANAYVVLYWTEYWVDFKLFGSLAMTFLFVIAQGLWLMRHGEWENPTKEQL